MTIRSRAVSRAFPFIVCVAAFFVALIAPPPALATIAYRVSLAHPDDHRFQVTMTVPVAGKEAVVALPAWNGLYRVRDFSYRVRDVAGVCPGLTAVPLQTLKLDKQTWRISLNGPCQPGDHNSFELHYSVEWNELGPFNSQLDARHAFVNLAEILMYVPDRRSEGVSVQFADLPEGWRTAAELESAHADNAYGASSYDTLVDAPVEAGKFEQFEFVESTGHFRVIVDANKWNKGLLEESLHRITKYELQLMGGPPFDPPSREYTFFFHISPDGDVDGGGMEHRNSNAISATSMEEAIAVAAHEFFHVWNVKRIRPQALEPVDYTKEQYTRALWFAEGVTSTYAAYTLERSGLWSKSQFYIDLATQIGRLQARPARRWQSVEESSLDAWFEGYGAYNEPDRSISYYNKGQILGVLLDLAIRDATDNHKSLDDVLRRMNAEYAQQGKFYDESAGILSVVNEVAGRNFDDFFRRYVSGTDEIPYNDFLSIAGLELKSGGGDNSDINMPEGAHLSFTEIAHPTDRQRRIRNGLLTGSTD
jgi:predicted metalloprotease with PDZ domain